MNSLSSLFSLYILTPGRRIYALGRIRALLEGHGVAEILPAVDAAIAHDREVLEMTARWRRGRGAGGGELRALDGVVDRTLGTIDRLLAHYSQDGDDAVADRASAVRGRLFPDGVGHHTSLPYVEQIAATERVLTIAGAAENLAWMTAHGLSPLVRRLRAAQDEFAAAVNERDTSTPLSWDEIKAAQSAGQELYLQVVALIAGRFATDAEMRTELLKPVWEQNQAIQEYRRRRGSVRDVDPDSGEELDDSEAPSSDGEVGDDAPGESADSGDGDAGETAA